MFELDRSTFRRLVQLQIVSFAATIAVSLRTASDSRWLEFDAGFNILADTYFAADPFNGEPGRGIVTAMSVLIAWTSASMAGLFWFKRWARFGFWASAIALTVFSVALGGERPAYDAPLDDALATVSAASFGAIVLLSYAKGYGAEWFGRSVSEVKD